MAYANWWVSSEISSNNIVKFYDYYDIPVSSILYVKHLNVIEDNTIVDPFFHIFSALLALVQETSPIFLLFAPNANSTSASIVTSIFMRACITAQAVRASGILRWSLLNDWQPPPFHFHSNIASVSKRFSTVSFSWLRSTLAWTWRTW